MSMPMEWGDGLGLVITYSPIRQQNTPGAQRGDRSVLQTALSAHSPAPCDDESVVSIDAYGVTPNPL
ncbi:hypothetical protein PC9H_000011 [Pleurotus ostreatus]|uniref:Uncharacterized protein n=1 Tax=Pleurotus ostreatus TaxID=5322 RepID=A0A8H7A098_PLEOS|nr:uncharacterized protein PC9H_000011 [Pleurotus ostreatus]KAF7439675.1 hypothetical protein PC9H_000011 [Pleurotus ostreatus]KAJ8701168.1 hypothetical protein PTI98_004125 [Pleurotus ostreatus]